MTPPDRPAGRPILGRLDHWFANELLPSWLDRAADAAHGGFFDRLSDAGEPYADDPKTTLVQGRLLFTFAHVIERLDAPAFAAPAEEALRFLETRLRDPADGGYVRAVERDGSAAAGVRDPLKDAYDHAFVLLGLAAWLKATGDEQAPARIEACWRFVEARLWDAETGGLHEDDRATRPGAPYPLPRRQNPQMHMFEATLELFDATGDELWLDRARTLLALFRTRLLDPATGTLREFLGPGFAPLSTARGAVREPGHHFEWVWLLNRFATLSGDRSAWPDAETLYAFASRFGVCGEGAMKSAVRDEVAPDGAPLSAGFLLWPQTEGIKARLAWFEQTGEAEALEEARRLAALVLDGYVAPDRRLWRNRLDAAGRVLQPDALSRLLYHLAVLITEGRRLGAWGEAASP